MKPTAWRPLWRLLLSFLKGEAESDFTCDECFRLLEYLADIRAQNSVSPVRLQILVQRHLTVCPQCRDHYKQVLEYMESLVKLNATEPS